MLDKFKDECGVFGIFGNPEAATVSHAPIMPLGLCPPVMGARRGRVSAWPPLRA